MPHSQQYHWQLAGWPHFTFDTAAAQPHCDAFLAGACRLQGQFAQLTAGTHQDALVDSMITEALHSFAIEGERLSQADLRSSLRNHLGLNPVAERVGDRRAEGVAALMLQVRSEVMAPLTHETLHQWHRLLMDGNVSGVLKIPLEAGVYRSNPEPMQIVSGPVGYERVHYEAPPAANVLYEMQQLLDWFNSTAPDAVGNTRYLSGPVRAAVLHLWFESVHPYEDGNGRIGRALAEKALFQSLGAPAVISLSAAIDADRKQYYQQLSAASRTLDITNWVQWFCQTCCEAQRMAAKQVEGTLAKHRFWLQHASTVLNDRQVKAINRLFLADADDGFAGGMNAQKYASLTRCSKATATRDLADLCEKACLTVSGTGRSTRYGLR
jgi:Fic family protein